MKKRRGESSTLAVGTFAMSSTETPTAKSPAVRWLSIDPRTNCQVPYSTDDTEALEAAFQRGDTKLVLMLGGNRFVVTFAEMIQRNASGGARKVIRTCPLPSFTAKITVMPQSVADEILSVCAERDASVEKLRAKIHDRSYVMPWDSRKDSCVVAALTNVIDIFKSDRYRAKYGFAPGGDESVLRIKCGDPVPPYFANVVSQSIYQRKMLSLAGLRNMMMHGLEIFEEMRMQRFSGKIEDYAPKKGPHKMKYFSGSVVDLDTVVLNAKQQVKTVNEVLKMERKAQFKDAADFEHSPLARQMVVDQAKLLIDDFCSVMKLTKAEIAARQLNFDENAPIPVSSSNADRGKWPVWQYKNVGISTFHVNVPTMPDVYGALLHAPFHLAKAFALLHVRFAGASAGEFESALDDFFEEAVSDSCFNGKWKAIEQYLSTIESAGSITQVLYELQASHQDVFTKDFLLSDPSRAKEAATMWRLAESSQLKGRDSEGRIRPITKSDVDQWIQAQE